jgi:hypothetical protein
VTPPRSNESASAHVDDGVLLAIHDQQLDTGLDAARLHVQRCAECTARMAAIARHGETVRDALASISVPSLDASSFRRRLARTRSARAVSFLRRPATLAAAAVIVVAVAAAASPVRHWLTRRMGRAAPPPTLPKSNDHVVKSKLPAGATISFAAPGPEFTVTLDSLPAAGVVTASRTIRNEISARVAHGVGTGGDAMVVLPNELRLHNSEASRASYDILVPGAISRLVVVVAGRRIFAGPPPARVDLTR